MATNNDPGGSGPPGRTLPDYMDPDNRFGALTILLMKRTDNGSLSKSAFHIGTTIEQTAGKIFGAKTENDGERYVLYVRNPVQAAKLLKVTELVDGTKVTVETHPKLNKCKCVISSRDIMDLEETALREGLREQKVVDVRRITRMENGKKVNTPAVVLTLSCTTYPDAVYVGPLRIPTRPYYPNPTLCYNCFRYAHIKSRCPGPNRCSTCSDSHETEEVCQMKPYCINCEGEHRPTSRSCPVYQREVDVIHCKIDYNISFQEARRRVEENPGATYAKVASKKTPTKMEEEFRNIIAKKDEEIAKLAAEMAELKKFVKSRLRSCNCSNSNLSPDNERPLDMLPPPPPSSAPLPTSSRSNLTSGGSLKKSNSLVNLPSLHRENSQEQLKDSAKSSKDSSGRKHGKRGKEVSPPESPQATPAKLTARETRRNPQPNSESIVDITDEGSNPTNRRR